MPSVLAILAVLFVSAIEHDIQISVGTGFFLPVYAITYGLFGGEYIVREGGGRGKGEEERFNTLSSLHNPAILVFLKPPMDPWIDQMIMSFMLTVGSGIQMSVYVTEQAARMYCPPKNDGWFGPLQAIDCYRKFNQ